MPYTLQEDTHTEYKYVPQPPEATIPFTLATLLLMVLLGTLMAAGFAIALGLLYGFDVQEMFSHLNINSTYQERSTLRLIQGVSHLFTFCIAAWATLWVVFRWFRLPIPHIPSTSTQQTAKYLNLHRSPKAKYVLAAVLLLLAAAPLVQYLYMINKAMYLPEWMRALESQATEAIKGFLKMDNLGELMVNLVVVALLPAVGEELIFRGILQPQMYRLFHNGWVAVLVTGFVFSAIHMQFEGFLARWFLGILLGWLYLMTNNLWVPIIAHFFNNGLQVVIYYLHQKGISNINLDDDIDMPSWSAGFSLFLVTAICWWIESRTKEPEA